MFNKTIIFTHENGVFEIYYHLKGSNKNKTLKYKTLKSALKKIRELLNENYELSKYL